MKRDWRLIRDILLGHEEQWADKLKVARHIRLCIEAGFVHPRKQPDDPSCIVASVLTPLGMDWADLLRSENRLIRVLSDLQEKNVGPSSDVLKAALIAAALARAGVRPHHSTTP